MANILSFKVVFSFCQFKRFRLANPDAKIFFGITNPGHGTWRALVQAERTFMAIRARFAGKASPAHFVWCGFGLAVTVRGCPVNNLSRHDSAWRPYFFLAGKTALAFLASDRLIAAVQAKTANYPNNAEM
jgi:Family of unknown function (DUF5996)